MALEELFDHCMARIDKCRNVRSGCITPPAICLLTCPLQCEKNLKHVVKAKHRASRHNVPCTALKCSSRLDFCRLLSQSSGEPGLFPYRGDTSSRDSHISLGLYSTTCASLCVFNAQAAGREPRVHAAGRRGVRTATSLHRMSSDNLRSSFLNVTYWRMVLLLGV